jgi:phosphoribosyl-ATP pyrophosphohydrolase
MFTLDILAETIALRAEAGAGKSYTRSLLDKGARHCARKFGEEAIEFTIAAVAEDDDAVRAEAADVLYHLLVALRARGIGLSDVLAVLENRTRQSGLEEKAARAQ